MSARPAVVQSTGRGLAQSRLLACSVTPHAVTFTNSGLIVTLAARLRLPALYPSARWPRAAGFPCSIPRATEADGAGIAQVRNQPVETTAWLRMESEAKRSRGQFSLQFAICREIFRNCRDSRSVVSQIS